LTSISHFYVGRNTNYFTFRFCTAIDYVIGNITNFILEFFETSKCEFSNNTKIGLHGARDLMRLFDCSFFFFFFPKLILSPRPQTQITSPSAAALAAAHADGHPVEQPLGKAGAAAADGAGAAALRLPAHRRPHQVPAFTPPTPLPFPLPQTKSSPDPSRSSRERKTEGTPRFAQLDSVTRVS
jgi:hypothetical protein